MSKYHFINKLLKNYFLYHIFFFIYIDCQLIIPLKYFPVYKYNYSNPSETMKTIVVTKAYATIEIGTPKQTIQIPLDFSSNDFYISENPIKDFNQRQNLFSDIKFYNANITSYSRVSLDDVMYDGDNFNLGEYCRESFYFNNQKIDLDFYYPIQLKYPESGGIGLLLQSSSSATPNEEKTFLKKIKDKNLIKNYYWSIFYNSIETTKEEEAFILLGLLPDEMKTNLGYYTENYFNKNDLKSVNAEISVGILTNKFIIDKIEVFEGNDKTKLIYDFPINGTSIKNIELNYHLRGVQAPYILLEKYEKYFEEFINKEECFKDEFTDLRKKYFFYCKNDKNIITKVKSKFPSFRFRSNDLDYNFYLEADDLFFEKNNYIYCLLFFHYSTLLEANWIMGKPFLKKYQFSFNPDNKQIFFYSKKDDNKGKTDELNGKMNLGTIVIIVLITVINVSIIFFLIFKFFIYEKINRKKRANELDDDFEYVQKNDNRNENNLGINSY